MPFTNDIAKGSDSAVECSGPSARASGRDRALIANRGKVDHRSALETFLRRLMLRSRLTKAEQEAILALPGEEVRTDAHRDIVRPGQVTDFSCLVVSGLVGRFDQLANGHRQITALHIIGDFCDLHSLAVPESGWGLESLTDSVIHMVPHEALGKLVESSPAFAMAFWRDTVVDSSILAKWNSALGRRSAKARLAHLLCEMGMRFEQAGLGEHHDFDFPITQAQLADVLGVTAVHLNRTMQALRQDELLVTSGSRFRLPNRKRLCQVAQFDPSYLLLGQAIDHVL